MGLVQSCSLILRAGSSSGAALRVAYMPPPVLLVDPLPTDAGALPELARLVPVAPALAPGEDAADVEPLLPAAGAADATPSAIIRTAVL